MINSEIKRIEVLLERLEQLQKRQIQRQRKINQLTSQPKPRDTDLRSLERSYSRIQDRQLESLDELQNLLGSVFQNGLAKEFAAELPLFLKRLEAIMTKRAYLAAQNQGTKTDSQNTFLEPCYPSGPMYFDPMSMPYMLMYPMMSPMVFIPQGMG